MKSLYLRCLFATFVTLLAWPVEKAGADDLDTGGLQAMGNTHYRLFDSETLGHPLHVYVRVPEVPDGEAVDPAKRYPVVYMLDGGVNFPMLASYYHVLRYGEELPRMVLVGLSYGSDTFEGGNFRSSDFTAPSEEREWWGKAGTFQKVLETELMPMIEGAYPADPKKRILIGQSLGGQFVLYNALSRPELFWGHIASNPALHRNLGYFMNWSGSQPMPSNATRLFVIEAEHNDARFKEPAMEWLKYWTEPGREKPFILEVRMLPDHSHLSAITESFRQGVTWLFE